jgi:hypothetical protein
VSSPRIKFEVGVGTAEKLSFITEFGPFRPQYAEFKRDKQILRLAQCCRIGENGTIVWSSGNEMPCPQRMKELLLEAHENHGTGRVAKIVLYMSRLCEGLSLGLR